MLTKGSKYYVSRRSGIISKARRTADGFWDIRSLDNQFCVAQAAEPVGLFYTNYWHAYAASLKVKEYHRGNNHKYFNAPRDVYKPARNSQHKKGNRKGRP